MTTKPFLKWVGGKTQILEKVFQHFPSTIANYHEPFLGGGSVLLEFLSKIRSQQIILHGSIFASDTNPVLISLYSHLQDHPDTLIESLTRLVASYVRAGAHQPQMVYRGPKTPEEGATSQESFYYWIRSRFNALQTEEKLGVEAAAMFLFLNKTCFRGLYREGPNGFNVPFGHYTNPSIFTAAHLHAVSELIQGVTFAWQDVHASLLGVGRDDFIYLDPPYAPETATSFVGYTAEGFSLSMHQTLFTRLKNLSQTKFLLSNADVPLVTNSFGEGYHKKVVGARRTINSKKPETLTKEVLIWN
jgi:DNA adenine methylase